MLVFSRLKNVQRMLIILIPSHWIWMNHMDNESHEKAKFLHEQWDYQFILSTPFIGFIDLIPEAVILSNTDGHILCVNQEAQRLLQYSREELLHLSIEDLVPEDIRNFHIKLRAWFFKNPKPRILEDRNYELCVVKKDKTKFPIESALFVMYTNKGPMAVNLMRDVTNQKKYIEKTTELAFWDVLTDLPNRRYF